MLTHTTPRISSWYRLAAQVPHANARDAGLRCLGRRLRVACVYTVAGAVSAVFTTPIQAPQELLKCTLQVLKLPLRGLLRLPLIPRHYHSTYY